MLHVQTMEIGDIANAPHFYELASIDFEQIPEKRVQYPGGSVWSDLRSIWKTSDTTASSFIQYRDWEGVDRFLLFLKDYKLYDEIYYSEEDTLLVGDTIWTSTAAEYLWSEKRLGNSGIMGALMGSWDTDHVGFVALADTQVLIETDTLFLNRPGNLALHGQGSNFMFTWRGEGTSDLWSMSYDPLSGEFTDPVQYFAQPAGSLESPSKNNIVVDEQNYYLQLPLKHDSSSTDAENWAGIIRHTISRADLSITQTDTVIMFDQPQFYIMHRITVKDGIPHSMIATFDGVQTSRLYYYGPLNVVSVDPAGYQPETFKVSKAYPNPFNGAVHLQVDISGTSELDFSVYDLQGRAVYSRQISAINPGQQILQWSGQSQTGESLGSGVYILSVRSGSLQVQEKVLLIK